MQDNLMEKQGKLGKARKSEEHEGKPIETKINKHKFTKSEEHEGKPMEKHGKTMEKKENWGRQQKTKENGRKTVPNQNKKKVPKRTKNTQTIFYPFPNQVELVHPGTYGS